MPRMDEYTAWASVPDHLKTGTQLGKLGLRLSKGQAPAATFYSVYHHKTYNLYDVLELGHAMSYGVYLELDHGGRYAIILRTMQANIPELQRGLTGLMDRL